MLEQTVNTYCAATDFSIILTHLIQVEKRQIMQNFQQTIVIQLNDCDRIADETFKHWRDHHRIGLVRIRRWAFS